MKPQSKDHTGAVKKSNPGKEKKQRIKPEGKSTTFPLLRGRGPCHLPKVIL